MPNWLGPVICDGCDLFLRGGFEVRRRICPPSRRDGNRMALDLAVHSLVDSSSDEVAHFWAGRYRLTAEWLLGWTEFCRGRAELFDRLLLVRLLRGYIHMFPFVRGGL